ncbi:unnamed protein product [Ectocarpus sp. 12 AP-2014]
MQRYGPVSIVQTNTPPTCSSQLNQSSTLLLSQHVLLCHHTSPPVNIGTPRRFQVVITCACHTSLPAVSVVCLTSPVHVLQGCVFVFNTNIGNYVLIPSRIIYLGEYYRVITGALLHGGLMHIVFNMMSFLSIGSSLEVAFGTLSLLFTILWSMILAGVVHCGAEWVMTVWVTHDPKYVNQASVGFSGVIFTLALIESYRSTQPTRSVFGMMRVPTRMYPWVLLVLLSVFMPNISFVGHLSGILVGVMHVYGLTKPLMPSPAFYIEMESHWWVRDSIGLRHNFVPYPPPALPTTADEQEQPGQSLRDSWQSCCDSIGACRRSLGNVAARFGASSEHGQNANGRNSNTVGSVEADPRGETETRGRLLPWGV